MPCHYSSTSPSLLDTGVYQIDISCFIQLAAYRWTFRLFPTCLHVPTHGSEVLKWRDYFMIWVEVRSSQINKRLKHPGRPNAQVHVDLPLRLISYRSLICPCQWAGGGGEGHEVGPGIYYAGFSTNRYSFSDSIDISFMPSTAPISVDTGQNYRVHPIMKGVETKTWLQNEERA